MEQGLYQTIRAVPHTTDKTMRIMSLQPTLESGYLLIPLDGMDLWKQEADEWAIEHQPAHVDGLDATELLWSIMRKGMRTAGEPTIMGDVHNFGSETKRDIKMQEPEVVRMEREARKAEAKRQREADPEAPPVDVEEEMWYPRIMR
jgi:hypothetical protein